MNEIRVHTIETGRLIGNHTFLRGEGWSSLFRRRHAYEFPAYSFVIEHPEGLIAIDTGINPRVRSPRPLVQRRFVPEPVARRGIGEALRARGLDPAEIARVVLTHLDWDHAGGVGEFQSAEILVHCPEWEFAQTLAGRQRYEPALWPAGFAPEVYDLDPEPYGPFPCSRPLTEDGSVRLIPLPGHSIGQVGVVIRSGDRRLLFCADHVLRQDWFEEDYDAGRLLGLGIWNRRHAIETSRRIHEFVASVPTILIPSHDEQAPGRLAALNGGGRSAR